MFRECTQSTQKQFSRSAHEMSTMGSPQASISQSLKSRTFHVDAGIPLKYVASSHLNIYATT